MTKTEIIDGMLDLLNGPEKWCKHILKRVDENGQASYCLLGALMHVTNDNPYVWSHGLDEMVDLFDHLATEKGYQWGPLNRPCVEFNNANETEYEDLRLFLKEAKERVA